MIKKLLKERLQKLAGLKPKILTEQTAYQTSCSDWSEGIYVNGVLWDWNSSTNVNTLIGNPAANSEFVASSQCDLIENPDNIYVPELVDPEHIEIIDYLLATQNYTQNFSSVVFSTALTGAPVWLGINYTNNPTNPVAGQIYGAGTCINPNTELGYKLFVSFALQFNIPGAGIVTIEPDNLQDLFSQLTNMQGINVSLGDLQNATSYSELSDILDVGFNVICLATEQDGCNRICYCECQTEGGCGDICEPVFGCTDPNAVNYNPEATEGNDCMGNQYSGTGPLQCCQYYGCPNTAATNWGITNFDELLATGNMVNAYNNFNPSDYSPYLDEAPAGFYMIHLGYAGSAIGSNGVQDTCPGVVTSYNSFNSIIIDDGSCECGMTQEDFCTPENLANVWGGSIVDDPWSNICSISCPNAYANAANFNYETGEYTGTISQNVLNVCPCCPWYGCQGLEAMGNDFAIMVCEKCNSGEEWPGNPQLQPFCDNNCCEGEYAPELPEPDTIEGCTDNTAINYNPDATEDDGSCEYMSQEEICNDFFALPQWAIDLTCNGCPENQSGSCPCCDMVPEPQGVCPDPENFIQTIETDALGLELMDLEQDYSEVEIFCQECSNSTEQTFINLGIGGYWPWCSCCSSSSNIPPSSKSINPKTVSRMQKLAKITPKTDNKPEKEIK